MRTSSNTVYAGIILSCIMLAAIWYSQSQPLNQHYTSSYKDEPDPHIKEWTDFIAPTKVLQHNGSKFERLINFCTWTLEFDCHMMRTPVGRIPFYMHNTDTDKLMKGSLAQDRDHDPEEIATLMRELRPLKNPVFVDIGANVGIYSVIIARTLNIHVLAVDPLVENVLRFCKTVQENRLTDNITLVLNAISDNHERVGFYSPEHHLEATEVVKLKNKYIGGLHSCVKPPSAMTCKLDDLLPLMTSKTAVIKIDVEAHEYRVLVGGQKFLDTIDVPAIYTEWVNVKGTPDGKLLLEFLRNRNYVAFSSTDMNTDGPHLDFDHFLDWPINVIWIKRK